MALIQNTSSFSTQTNWFRESNAAGVEALRALHASRWQEHRERAGRHEYFRPAAIGGTLGLLLAYKIPSHPFRLSKWKRLPVSAGFWSFSAVVLFALTERFKSHMATWRRFDTPPCWDGLHRPTVTHVRRLFGDIYPQSLHRIPTNHIDVSSGPMDLEVPPPPTPSGQGTGPDASPPVGPPELFGYPDNMPWQKNPYQGTNYNWSVSPAEAIPKLEYWIEFQRRVRRDLEQEEAIVVRWRAIEEMHWLNNDHPIGSKDRDSQLYYLESLGVMHRVLRDYIQSCDWTIEELRRQILQHKSRQTDPNGKVTWLPPVPITNTKHSFLAVYIRVERQKLEEGVEVVNQLDRELDRVRPISNVDTQKMERYQEAQIAVDETRAIVKRNKEMLDRLAADAEMQIAEASQQVSNS